MAATSNSTPSCTVPGVKKNQYYFVECRHSGKVWDVQGAGMDNGHVLFQYKKHGGANQMFFLDMSPGDGYCIIIARHSGKALDVKGSSKNQSAPVLQYDKHGGENQQFFLEPAEVVNGKQYYYVYARHSRLYLDVNGASQNDRAQIIQYGCHLGTNQQFAFIPAN